MAWSYCTIEASMIDRNALRHGLFLVFQKHVKANCHTRILTFPITVFVSSRLNGLFLGIIQLNITIQWHFWFVCKHTKCSEENNVTKRQWFKPGQPGYTALFSWIVQLFEQPCLKFHGILEEFEWAKGCLSSDAENKTGSGLSFRWWGQTPAGRLWELKGLLGRKNKKAGSHEACSLGIRRKEESSLSMKSWCLRYSRKLHVKNKLTL